MRIISLLPSATEILYLLGSGKDIVGVSHESEFPKKVKNLPILTSTTVNVKDSSLKIDQKVSKSLKLGQSIYKVNKKLLVSLKPNLVITQELCRVCAITPNNLQLAIKDCNPTPEILTLHPHSIKEIFEDILKVGKAIGKEREAYRAVQSAKFKVQSIKQKTAKLKNKPRVYCMEWLDPPYNGGHWVPEQVEIAGGRDELSVRGVDSVRVIWEKIVEYNPDILVLMPCGFSIERTKKELPSLIGKPEWKKLKAVKEGQVYLVNGPAYFNCSGPKVVKGIELLATIFHPGIFPNHFNRFALERLV